MNAELEAANGSSICAEYFFPKDKPGDAGVTALAICDTESQFLAGHVVDAKGASAEHAIGQVLRDLRKMGHYGSPQSKDGPRVIHSGSNPCRGQTTWRSEDSA